MRQPWIAGNWKMNTNRASAIALAREIADAAAAQPAVRVGIFPPFPYLLEVRSVAAGGPIVVGAQDVYPGPDGAFTGEVSTAMLRDCGVGAVLIGHSERRHILHEPEELIRQKLCAALAAGLEAVLCIGEKLEERRAGRTNEVNEGQLRSALGGFEPGWTRRLTIAYEPVWAIGTGVTATPADAQAAHEHIRRVIGEWVGPAAAMVRVLYGGSVKAANANELLSQPDVDGALVGGASLDAREFAAIIRAGAGQRA